MGSYKRREGVIFSNFFKKFFSKLFFKKKLNGVMQMGVPNFVCQFFQTHSLKNCFKLYFQNLIFNFIFIFLWFI